MCKVERINYPWERHIKFNYLRGMCVILPFELFKPKFLNPVNVILKLLLAVLRNNGNFTFTQHRHCLFPYLLYRVAHEKPGRRRVEQRGRRSRTLYRKLNKCKCKVLTG